MKMLSNRRLLATAAGILTLFTVLAGCRHPVDPATLRVGLAEEPRTLNVWLAGDANSRKVLAQIYQSLYIRDPKTLEPVPWLAADHPAYDPQTLCYTVRLREARWSDGSPLTSADVAFTAWLIKKFKIPRYSSRWSFVKKIETPDPRTVKFFLSKPKAIFTTRSLSAPIVPKKHWDPVAREALTHEKPLAHLLNHRMAAPVGSGPFTLAEWRQGAYLHMRRNPHFFGSGRTINGFRLGPHVEQIVFKFFGTADVAILALKKGAIDLLWWGIPPGYLDELQRDPDIRVYLSEKSALYFMGFNLRRPPFDDPQLRRAVALLIDKDFIISRILQGYGTRMHSVVPSGNSFWCCNQVERYGDGLERQNRIHRAHDLLRAAGYRWEVPPVDPQGRIQPARGMRLPDGAPMENFTILTPPADYDPHRAMAGLIIQEWLREIGMPAFARPMAFSSLLDRVKSQHDFDAFILGYGKLSLDPDYLRSFFHSKQDKKRGWNMSGYRNPEFDRLSTASSGAMDVAERRELMMKMQQNVIRDVPYIPLYNPHLIEAVRKERFTGWVEMVGGVGNPWTFSMLRPAGS